MLEIALLGQFNLRQKGILLDLSSRQSQKLLAYLALDSGRSVARSKLAGTLWPDSLENTARKNLRHYLWRLRQAIGEEYLQSTRNSVTFNQAADYQMDVEVLKKPSDDENIIELIEAVSAYKGELLPGFYDNWVQQERGRLQAIFERKMQILLDRLEAEARWSELLIWSEHWIAHSLTPEPAYRALMTGCAGLDDRAGVAMNYWRCKKSLKETLGVEPSSKTQSLFESLTQGVIPGEMAQADHLDNTASGSDPNEPDPNTGGQIDADIRTALARLSSGDESAIDQLSNLFPDSTRKAEVSDIDQFILVSEIRAVAEQQSITDESTHRLLQLVNESINPQPALLPEFLRRDESEPAHPVFVGRQSESTRLNSIFKEVDRGRGQMAFVVGDVGSGKTSLMKTFATQVSDINPDSLVVWGTCNTFSGLGDPYLPFRKALGMLVGDIEQAWWSGSITTSQGQRLWENMPATTEILLDNGPGLFNTLVTIRPLLNRLKTAFPAGHPLAKQLENFAAGQVLDDNSERYQLFEQVTSAMHQLSRGQPVVVFLDDLQWADRGSVDLLFHLGRSLVGARILIVGAYRPDQVRAGNEHPLRPMLAEFRRAFGDIWLDLDRASGKAFVNSYIDNEPNRLDQEFRNTLYQRTSGHALFTVELLQEMRFRGNLIQDESGRWTTGPSLNWNVLPAKVEGAIESRLSRLDEESLNILMTAAIEGEAFTVQSIARVLGLPEQSVLQTLSRKLGSHYKLVQEQVSESFGNQLINRFRFIHQMFQGYLYDRFSPAERQLMHGRVGHALEELYPTKSDELVAQLARHFDEAGENSNAAKYFLAAGDRARALFAHQEAEDNYQHAMEHFTELGDEEGLARTWMRLGLVYHESFDYARSRQAYDRGFEYWEKMSLSPQYREGEATLRLWSAEPVSFDPAVPAEDDTGIWLSQLYSGLVILSSEGVLVPNVARSWEIHDEGKTYLFYLRENARWSDGQPLTAQDFIFTWRRFLAPEASYHSAERLFEIKGAREFHQNRLADDEYLGLRAPDSHTLIIELEQPTSYFLQLLTAPWLYPRPSHAIQKFGRQWALPENLITNGAYKISKWSTDEGVMLERNTFYHAAYQGNVSQVEVTLLKSHIGWQEGMDLYLGGKIDYLDVSWFPGEVIRSAQRQFGEFYTTLLPRPTTISINFIPQGPPFDDIRLRQALAMTIDQEQMVRDLQKDNADPALGGYVPRGLAGHSTDIGLPYDPDTARRLLAEAGYPNGEGFPVCEIAWYDFPSSREQADYISQLWLEELGITIKPIYMPVAEMVASFVQDEPPVIYEGGWVADYHDPDNFLRLGTRSSIRNHRQIQNKIEAAKNMTDQSQRLQIYREIDQILIEEAIHIPLFYVSYPVFFGPRVRKVSTRLLWQDFILDPD
jgi:ABC-type oligopeptide transport system substrate-binding subunit/DNA-binding SARP family transcriptional activator